ncbi:MAG: hypothetical protein QM729_21435 [Solirubrobacterales bacterium]
MKTFKLRDIVRSMETDRHKIRFDVSVPTALSELTNDLPASPNAYLSAALGPTQPAKATPGADDTANLAIGTPGANLNFTVSTPNATPNTYAGKYLIAASVTARVEGTITGCTLTLQIQVNGTTIASNAVLIPAVANPAVSMSATAIAALLTTDLVRIRVVNTAYTGSVLPTYTGTLTITYVGP